MRCGFWFFSSRRRHTRYWRDWSSDVCSSDLGKKILADLLRHETQELIDGLFAVLSDRAIAPDDALPDTGVGLPRERVLSPAFIISPTYGTRSSSVVLVDNHGQVIFIERSFGERGKAGKSVTGPFALETAPTPASI